jgi:hypothetical protein
MMILIGSRELVFITAFSFAEMRWKTLVSNKVVGNVNVPYKIRCPSCSTKLFKKGKHYKKNLSMESFNCNIH